MHPRRILSSIPLRKGPYSGLSGSAVASLYSSPVAAAVRFPRPPLQPAGWHLFFPLQPGHCGPRRYGPGRLGMLVASDCSGILAWRRRNSGPALIDTGPADLGLGRAGSEPVHGSRQTGRPPDRRPESARRAPREAAPRLIRSGCPQAARTAEEAPAGVTAKPCRLNVAVGRRRASAYAAALG
jgi:hypothetical protein